LSYPITHGNREIIRGSVVQRHFDLATVSSVNGTRRVEDSDAVLEG
jgi:hypothetical protein